MINQEGPAGLVVIHGAGKEPSNYYQEFIATVEKALGNPVSCLAAWWSDLSNIGPAIRGGGPDPAQSSEALAFRQAFLQELGLASARKGSPAAGTRATRSLGSTIILLADVANDVVRYLFDAEARQRIQERLIKRLEEARKRFPRTVLVSHSLGTVISYDVLRQEASAYNVRTWFTTGSPLAKLVKLHRCSPQVGEIALPPGIRWENLYDPSDVVASALRQAFKPYPIHDVRVENGSGIMQSHDYWRNPQVARLVARALAGTWG